MKPLHNTQQKTTLDIHWLGGSDIKGWLFCFPNALLKGLSTTKNLVSGGYLYVNG